MPFEHPKPPLSVCFRARVETAIWRRWGVEVAVFEGRSAQTHLLVDGHAELFCMMAEHPLSLSIRDIASEFEGPEGTQTQQTLSEYEMTSLHTLLQELVALGLVEAIH